MPSHSTIPGNALRPPSRLHPPQGHALGIVIILSLSVIACSDKPVSSGESTLSHLGTVDLGEPQAILVQGQFRDVGSLDDPEETQFARLAWAAYSADSMVFAVDQGTRTLRAFDSEGGFWAEFGRLGDGPGEFRSPNWVGRCSPNTVTVFDYTLDRLTEVSTSGEVVGTLKIPDRRGYVVDRVRCHPSGRYVITQRDVTTLPSAEGPYRAGFLLQTMIGLTGDIKDLGVVRGQDRYLYPASDMPAPLGASISFAPDAERVFLTTGSEAKVFEIDLTSGDTTRVISWDPFERRINQRIRQDVVNSDLDLVRGKIPPATFQERREAWERTMFPEFLPETYDLLFDDSQETLWIEVSRPPVGGTGAPSILMGVSLVSSDPPLVLALPVGYSVFGVTANEVIGRFRDSLDVGLLSPKRLVRRGR